jgi:ribonuclease HII
MPDFSIEETFQGKIVAGVDEVGRGPWAGPVVACAAVLNPSLVPFGLNDSKKISKRKREDIYSELIETCDFGIGIVNESVIDQVNILEASKYAMKSAIFDLFRKPDIILVDGNQAIDVDGIECRTVVKGDSISSSIAAASIIAKVIRDNIMEDLDAEFPQYNWKKNQGYGTKEHLKALDAHGPSKHHRKSFAPVKKFYQTV